jgi:hypothetical protein
MKVYRTAALAAAACAAGLSLAACSGGLTSASSAPSSPAASSSTPPASSPAAGSSSPPASTSAGTSTGTSGSGTSGSGSTVSVGSAGSFPIPPGATVVENATSNGVHDIVLSGVKPAEVSSFYSSALPQAGYTITSNTQASGGAITGTAIEFNGHGCKGDIGAASTLGITGLSGLVGGNVIGITLTPQ